MPRAMTTDDERRYTAALHACTSAAAVRRLQRALRREFGDDPRARDWSASPAYVLEIWELREADPGA